MVVSKPIMVAELSINHLGMVKIAQKMIDAAIAGGADLVKLKYKNVKKYYKNDGKKWRNFNFKTYRGSLELSKEDFAHLANYCNNRSIKWFCTVHDQEGLDFIKSFDPPYYKVASMDADKHALVENVMKLCAEESKPIIISLGGKSDLFVESLVQKINKYKLKAYLLHTVSIYPTPDGKSNIAYISHLKNKFANEKISIGYSGHEVGYAPSILAALQGAKMIERHFSLSMDWKIHHIGCSLTPEKYKQMNDIIDKLLIEKKLEFNEFQEEELEFLKEMKYR